MDTFKKRLANLLTVKSLVTLILTGVFAFLAVTQQIAPAQATTNWRNRSRPV